MISIIIFGVIAVIVVVLLLTYNVRSFGRGQPTPPKADHSSERKPIEKQLEVSPSPLKVESKDEHMLDKDYRKSLRQFKAQASAKSLEPSQPSLNDKEYRSALRSITKPKD